MSAEPNSAWAAGRLRDTAGLDCGWLAAWRQDARPSLHALRADPACFDPHGGAAWISLAWAPAGFDLLFDDPAVQHARRRVLEDEPPAAVTSLSRDDSHIGGALTARRGRDARRLLQADPFARLLPARLYEVSPGLVGAAGPPASLVIERYGPAPWPSGAFR